MNYLHLDEIKYLVLNLPRSKYDQSDCLIDYPFEQIKVNSFEITCAAGPSTYCTPQEFYSSINDYESVMVSISEFSIKHNQHSLVMPCRDQRFSYFDWIKYFQFSSPYRKVSGSYMGCYVPKAVLYQIVKDIYKVSRLGTFF